jgi:hypothetical protein
MGSMTKLFQLFRTKVDESLLSDLLACYGLEGLIDVRFFSREDLKRIGTVEKVGTVADRLRACYISYKASTYFDGDLTEKRCITILRQVLRLYDFRLQTKERYHSGKKTIYYRLQSMRDDGTRVVVHAIPHDETEMEFV